jgi:hypothetical protein
MSEVNDPKWGEMWYLNRRDGLTMNVQGELGKAGTEPILSVRL